MSCSFSLYSIKWQRVLVIGSNLPIIAAPGDDVILPCHLEPMFDVQGLTVEWSKPDLKPDPSDRLSRVGYVHLYRDRQEVPDMKMASYFRRTELFMDDMKHGNISLKILNVSEEDNGRYRCFIPKLQSRVKAAVVELVVGEKICFDVSKKYRSVQGLSGCRSYCLCVGCGCDCVFLSPSNKMYIRNKQTQTCCCFFCHQTDLLFNFFQQKHQGDKVTQTNHNNSRSSKEGWC
uniref:Ig-like domain-containing protein n=1 Tax=Astatotilapia calliptera TaxID=8154 RepID=A0A3P8Q2P8_ASTCA